MRALSQESCQDMLASLKGVRPCGSSLLDTLHTQADCGVVDA